MSSAVRTGNDAKMPPTRAPARTVSIDAELNTQGDDERGWWGKGDQRELQDSGQNDGNDAHGVPFAGPEGRKDTASRNGKTDN
ncbi:MAG: hypothetical protein F6K00_33450 [Leptolyngbya sp. SIOISBB]|nr:hypothetical protein [Leptolyngbya sp. SIOISBB]